MLRDDKNHDRLQLGIKHAAPLIRRKSNFGAEVKDHAEEIAMILCNLQDPFKTEDFNEQKLQAMIAVLISNVKNMAPWFSRQAFLGDYSIAQRGAILSALGLGGREVAGLKTEDHLNPALSNIDFPSKRLPSPLHSIYAVDQSSTKRLEAASKGIEQALIEPLALQAADQSTAHLNAVKVRTFSSRMEVERTKRKPTPNALAKIFGEAFFFPLANRYQQEIAAYSTSSVYSSTPFLLVTFIKTLALLFHASGPATIGLVDISDEFWNLLLSLRVTALGDISILQAVLFSLLTLLEVNSDKQRIVQEHPKQLMETQQWVAMVFERMGGGGSTSDNVDEAKVQTLAAGVLVKTREVIEAYQKELIEFTM
jgi:telomere length regulation protein